MTLTKQETAGYVTEMLEKTQEAVRDGTIYRIYAEMVENKKTFNKTGTYKRHQLFSLKGQHAALYSALVGIANRRGSPVVIKDMPFGLNGQWSCFENYISLNRRNTPSERASTLIHELAHSILHSDRIYLGREEPQGEVEAEGTLHVVCKALGLDYQGAPYYVAGQDPRLIDFERAVERIHVAANTILTELEKEGPVTAW